VIFQADQKILLSYADRLYEQEQRGPSGPLCLDRSPQ